MTQTYALTISPSCYKKWDFEFVRALLLEGGTVYKFNKKFKNFNSLPYDDQMTMLKVVVDKLAKSLPGSDWGEIRFEDTQKGNRHVHVYFSFEGTTRRPCTTWPHNFQFNMDMLNVKFSSGKDIALFIEETIIDLCFWKKYIEKAQWLESLKYSDFPETP